MQKKSFTYTVSSVLRVPHETVPDIPFMNSTAIAAVGSVFSGDILYANRVVVYKSKSTFVTSL